MAETTGPRKVALGLLRKAHGRARLIVTPHRSGGGTQPDWKAASDLGELASYYTNLWVRLLTQGKSGLGLLEPSTV